MTAVYPDALTLKDLENFDQKYTPMVHHYHRHDTRRPWNNVHASEDELDAARSYLARNPSSPSAKRRYAAAVRYYRRWHPIGMLELHGAA